MGQDRLQETLGILAKAREQSPAILVAFSGGKDAWATLDLCSRSFDKVIAVNWWIVPGLRQSDEQCEEAYRRYGCEILRLPHFWTGDALRAALYCDPDYQRQDKLPRLTRRDLMDIAKAKTGIPLVADGGKRADSPWKRRTLAMATNFEDVIHPLIGWRKVDVLAHIGRLGIVPWSDPDEKAWHAAREIDLSTEFLLWCKDKYPDDFGRLLEVFPYAEECLWREYFYEGNADAIRAPGEAPAATLRGSGDGPERATEEPLQPAVH